MLEDLRHAFVHGALCFVEFLVVGVEFCCFFLGGLGGGGGGCCAADCFAVGLCEFEGEEGDVVFGMVRSL